MNILFPYMARWSSANASRYYHLLTHVAELGHKVYVLQPPSRGSPEANDIDVPLRSHPNIFVQTVPISSKLWKAPFFLEKLVKKFYFTMRSTQLVKQIIKEKKIDLLYLYNLPQFLYLLGTKPTVVFDFADDLLGMLQMELSISSRHLVYGFANKLLQWIFKRCDLIICTSAPLYELVDHKNKFLITNGSTIPVCSDSDVGIDEKNKNKVTVGYVGAFEPYMALEMVIDAAEHLPQVQFVLVGTGRNFTRIDDMVKSRKLNNVTLTGPLQHDKAMKMIERMDICLNLFHKSRVSDAVSPLKLFEYLARRKPVISTRLKEVERINQDFIYFADNVDELVKTIQNIITQSEEAKERVYKGYKIVAQDFSWPKIAKDFLHAIRSINPNIS